MLRVLRVTLAALSLACAETKRSRRYRMIDGIKRDFLAAVARASRERADAGQPPPAVALLDVGANTGAFSQAMMRRLQRAAPAAQPRLVMFEPQPQFGAALGALASRWHGEHVAAAAWTEAANLTFYTNANLSEAATLAASAADDRVTANRRHRWTPTTVRAVSLAAYLKRVLPPAAARGLNASFAFVKLDVEGAEYDLPSPVNRLLSLP